jgi:hypothetical protein
VVLSVVLRAGRLRCRTEADRSGAMQLATGKGKGTRLVTRALALPEPAAVATNRRHGGGGYNPDYRSERPALQGPRYCKANLVGKSLVAGLTQGRFGTNRR